MRWNQGFYPAYLEIGWLQIISSVFAPIVTVWFGFEPQFSNELQINDTQ